MKTLAIILLGIGALMIITILFKYISICNNEDYAAFFQGRAGYEADLVADDLRKEIKILAAIGTVCIIIGYIILKVVI